MQEALPPRKVATQALDTLALGLPAKLVAPAALEFVEQGVQQADAGTRVAACSVLAVLSEGCADALRTRDRFAALLPAVTQCTADADPGVRAAAATCIGEMACAPLPHARDRPQMCACAGLLCQLHYPSHTRERSRHHLMG